MYIQHKPLLVIFPLILLAIIFNNFSYSLASSQSLSLQPISLSRANLHTNANFLNSQAPTFDIGPYVVVGIALSLALFMLYRPGKHGKIIRDMIAWDARSTNRYIEQTSNNDTLLKDKLDSIANRVKDILVASAAIYGILLTFIVTNQLNNIFSSWTLIIWISFIMAILARIGRYLRLLSDVTEIEDLRYAAARIYHANRFSYNSIWSFVMLIALTPVFSITPPHRVKIFPV